MNNKNQITFVENFLDCTENNLIISSPTLEVEEFYRCVLKYFSKKNGFSFINSTEQELNIEADLFDTKVLKYFYTRSTSKISELIKLNEKKILFTDYKNYKKYKSECLAINGYLYEKDIEALMVNYFHLNDQHLRFFCKLEPAMCLSEIDKFMINNNNYFPDNKIKDHQNFILNLRKSAFELKTNGKLKELYSVIKNEKIYKKFNFLTY